jgi:uncharacterized membrane protein YfcA
MSFELSLANAILLILIGLLAGFMNTVGGGGSMLSLPVLMLLGLPAHIANGTNRLGIFLQCVLSSREFYLKGKIEKSSIVPVAIPTLIGALVGAVGASYLSSATLKPLLLATMISMGIVMLVKPALVAPPEGTSILSYKERPMAWVALFLSGVYGGFVQGGVGLVIILSLTGMLRYDLIRANALMLLTVALFTIVAVCVFAAQGQIMWMPGLVLALGMGVGGLLGVRVVLNIRRGVLEKCIFASVLLTCGVALVR